MKDQATTKAWEADGKTRSGLRYRMRAYAEHSSIKCLPKMIRAKSLLHRALWAASFIIGTSMAVYLLYGLWSLYFSYEVTLSVSTQEGARPPFPDITVCNLNPLWSSGADWGLHAHVDGVDDEMTYEQYVVLLFRKLYQSASGQSSFETTDAELYSASGFLKHTEYDDQKLMTLSKKFIWKCSWESENMQTDCVVNSTITPRHGLCYTLRPPSGHGQRVKTRLEGLSVILFLNNINLRFIPDFRISPFHSYTEGVKVLLHPQGTAPDMSNGFTATPGNEASMVASYTKRELLPHPYGSCQRDMRLDMFDNTQAENVWNYTEYACRSLCYQSKIIKECGCLDSTEITFHDLTQKHRFCSIYSENDPQKANEEINCTRSVKIALDATDSCTKICPTSCSRDNYDNSINQVPWPHEIYLLGLYYTYMWRNPPSEDFRYYYEGAVNLSLARNQSAAWDLVRSTNLIQRNFLQLSVTMNDIISTGSDKPAITVEGIIGNLGGILNLWIGFTFITIMEFVDFFLTVFMDRFWTTEMESDDKKANESRAKQNMTMVEPTRF